MNRILLALLITFVPLSAAQGEDEWSCVDENDSVFSLTIIQEDTVPQKPDPNTCEYKLKVANNRIALLEHQVEVQKAEVRYWRLKHKHCMNSEHK